MEQGKEREMKVGTREGEGCRWEGATRGRRDIGAGEERQGGEKGEGREEREREKER